MQRVITTVALIVIAIVALGLFGTQAIDNLKVAVTGPTPTVPNVTMSKDATPEPQIYNGEKPREIAGQKLPLPTPFYWSKDFQVAGIQSNEKHSFDDVMIVGWMGKDDLQGIPVLQQVWGENVQIGPKNKRVVNGKEEWVPNGKCVPVISFSQIPTDKLATIHVSYVTDSGGTRVVGGTEKVPLTTPTLSFVEGQQDCLAFDNQIRIIDGSGLVPRLWSDEHTQLSTILRYAFDLKAASTCVAAGCIQDAMNRFDTSVLKKMLQASAASGANLSPADFDKIQIVPDWIPVPAIQYDPAELGL